MDIRIEHRINEAMLWESQVCQYPKLGPAGISYFRGDFPDDPERYADCLLFRDKHGKLRGILNHYPVYISRHEKVGYVNIWVEPRFQRKGIGTKLLAEALKRWEINFEQQKYSPSGERFIRKFLNKFSYSAV